MIHLFKPVSFSENEDLIIKKQKKIQSLFIIHEPGQTHCEFFFHNSTLLMLHAKSWTSFKVKIFKKVKSGLAITYANDFWVFTYSDVTDVKGKNSYLTK